MEQNRDVLTGKSELRHRAAGTSPREQTGAERELTLKMSVKEMEYTVRFYEWEVVFARKHQLNGSAMQALLDARKKELKELKQELKRLELAEYDRARIAMHATRT